MYPVNLSSLFRPEAFIRAPYLNPLTEQHHRSTAFRVTRPAHQYRDLLVVQDHTTLAVQLNRVPVNTNDLHLGQITLVVQPIDLTQSMALYTYN